MKTISNSIIKHANLIVAAGALLALLGGYFTFVLYTSMRTDIQELLPQNARSVLDMKEIQNRLESVDSISVLLLSSHPEASKKFVIDLAAKLSTKPKAIIAGVDFRENPEMNFFRDRAPLYVDLNDLIKIKTIIKRQITEHEITEEPLSLFSGPGKDRLTLLNLKKQYESQASKLNGDGFKDGFYATPDEKRRVMFVKIPGEGLADGGKKFKKTIEDAIQELGPHSYAPDLEIHYSGGVEDGIEEQAALIKDLTVSTILVIVVVMLAMLLFFRASRATMALLISLLFGTLWTFGVSYFLVGYLNANSAFLGSIVIGNGINFGIIFLARYLEERRRNHNHQTAIHITMAQTSKSTFTAALAAALSYGSLMLTEFRGFNQFGTIGFVGMLLCWLSAYTLLPALLTVLEKSKPLVMPHFESKKHFSAGKLIANFVARNPKAICIVSLVTLILSLGTFVRLNSNILETNLSNLRSKQSSINGSAHYGGYVGNIFQHYVSHLVLLPNSREEAIKIKELLNKQKRQAGANSLIASVQTLDDLIPSNQKEKIKEFKEIKSLLTLKIIKQLPASERSFVEQFSNREVKDAFTEIDIPASVIKDFTEKNGERGRMVLIEPPISNKTENSKTIIQFIHQLRDAADSVGKNIPLAGGLTVVSDITEVISHDGPRATLFSFLAVLILVTLLFRNFKTISLTLFSLILGVTWLLGIILGFKLKINFLNFIALPITFGIGVDYGVNIFQRYREEKSKDIVQVIQNTGGAVGLCSFSTIVGYFSLIIADNQGFVSFGMLAIAGELTCIIAAVIALPAFLEYQKQKSAKE